MADRPDLAAMTVRLGRALVAIEAPILDKYEISMWGYIVLTALRRAPLRGQSVLAEAIGADKTRLIAVLDELQQRRLIRRDPDPADRRARILALTKQGERLQARVQQAIRREETRLLEDVRPRERETFLRVLQELTRRTCESDA